MRQGSRGVKAEVDAKRPVGGSARKPLKAKAQAKRRVTKKAPKRKGSKGRESEKRLAEALEREAAISEILNVMSSSPGDVQPVLEAVAKRAAHLCDAPYANVLIRDGEMLRPSAFSRLPKGKSVLPIPLTRSSVNGRAVLDRKTFHHADIVPFLDSEFPDARQNVERLGVRAHLAVPLLRESEACGTITVFRHEPRSFSPEQIALVETFARQAVIAIENVRLFNETKEALERQTATAEILKVISESPTDVQPVFDAIVRSAKRVFGALTAVATRFAGDTVHLAAFSSTDSEGDEVLKRLYPRPIADTMMAEAARTGAIVVVGDVLSDPRVPSAVREVARARGYRSMLIAPMLRDGVAMGTINISRAEAGPFSDHQQALIKTFSDQAVIAIENVRLFNETKEALERQTATSEILRVISQSPRDVQPVFDTIAAASLKLCHATSAALFTYDGKLMHLGALANLNPEAAAAISRTFPRPIGRYFTVSRAVLTRSVVAIPDVLEDPEYDKPTALAGGYRSALAVPLMREGKVIGGLAIHRPEPGLFPEKQVALLQTFAAQAVIAIENVRLFTELEARTTQLTQSVGELKALGEVGQAVSSTLDLETVLRTIVSRANQLTGMDGGAIFEYDEARGEFSLHATDNLPDELVEALGVAPIPKGEGAIGQLAVTGEPVQVRDIVDEVSYQSRVRDILIRIGSRALLAVPLLREDRLLGGLVVNRKSTGEFTPEMIDLLKTFATQSALAIQNARLFREIEVKSRELEAASRHKSEFLANMSHELRTPLNAIIGFSEVLSERMFGEINEKQAEYIADILQSGQHLLSLINDILDLSKIEAGRMELELSDFDLPGTIENTLTLVRERAVRRGITLGRTVDERLGTIRADERKVKQVLLNLLSNALKFTPEGGKIDVLAAVSDGVAKISVTDTGVGIAPEEQEAVFEEFRQVGTAAKKVEGTGLGLAISRKFIELHGGRIWVKSQVGSGSTFAFTLPLR